MGRGKSQRGKLTYGGYSGANGAENRQSEPADLSCQKEKTSSRKAAESNESEAAITSLQDRTKWPELSAVRKVSTECISPQETGWKKKTCMSIFDHNKTFNELTHMRLLL